MYRYNASDKSGSIYTRPARGKAATGVFARVFDLIIGWADRARQRRHLARLDDRLLRDIGISRADVEAETSRRFWRQDF